MQDLNTPLHYAVIIGDVKVATLLIDRGAKLDVQNKVRTAAARRRMRALPSTPPPPNVRSAARRPSCCHASPRCRFYHIAFTLPIRPPPPHI